MIISIASGKGGTGKTTVATNLAFAIEKAHILDCDVEEPNSHIFIKPKITSKEPVYIPVPEIDKSKCDFCGKCAEVCAFKALAVLKTDVLVFPELCHGCGACEYLCPQKAMKEVNRTIGYLETGTKGDLFFTGGKLNIGEAMATPIIKAVTDSVKPDMLNIIDAPPGTSCSMIESVTHSDYCILVTEPTPFGLNDMILSVEVLRKLKVPFGILINRSDLGDDKTVAYCEKENIPIVMKIPFDKNIAKAYSQGRPIVEALPEYKQKFIDLYNNVKEKIS
ncbi:MAG: ATP-binding protein [Elusimicrobiota bacterium]|nr:ATP-binding protein [Elusimicrobiota bacterium]